MNLARVQLPTRRRGFTIVEAVIAIVVLSTAMPPMLWAIRQAQQHRAAHILSSRAAWLAEEKLEDVIADRHSSTRGYSYLAAANYPAEGSIAGFPGFSRAVTFAETGAALAGAGTGYKRITVTVTYADATGVQRSLVLASLVTEYTP